MKEVPVLPTTTLSVGTDQTFEVSFPDFQTVRRVDLYVRRISGTGTLANIQFQPVSAGGSEDGGDIIYGYTNFQSSSGTQARHWEAPAAPVLRVKLDVVTAACDVKITAVVYD